MGRTTTETACWALDSIECSLAIFRAHLEHVLAGIEFITISKVIATRAGSIPPATVRALDAIHLATALSLQPGLEAFVACDDRLAEAARALGLPVVAPA